MVYPIPGIGSLIFRITFMSQLRNIFALIISHFYGIMDRNWDFRSFLYFSEMPDVTRGGLHHVKHPIIDFEHKCQHAASGAWRI